jgi:hypothetical protein
LNDDRCIYRYTPGEGSVKLFACSEFAGEKFWSHHREAGDVVAFTIPE